MITGFSSIDWMGHLWDTLGHLGTPKKKPTIWWAGFIGGTVIFVAFLSPAGKRFVVDVPTSIGW